MEKITCATSKGGRLTQEDRFVGIPLSETENRAWLLGVFDGHGGSAAVAEYCAKEVRRTVCPSDFSDPEGFLRKLVARLNEETRGYHEGSTLSLALVIGRKDGSRAVSAAILGDSPVIILDRTGRITVGPEHNVRSNAAERKAVMARGGEVANGYVYPPACDYGLQLSRALGDRWLDGILSREPEILTVADPVWVLVASDGIFDPSHMGDVPLSEIKPLVERGASADDVLAWADSFVLQDNATAVVWRAGSEK